MKSFIQKNSERNVLLSHSDWMNEEMKLQLHDYTFTETDNPEFPSSQV